MQSRGVYVSIGVKCILICLVSMVVNYLGCICSRLVCIVAIRGVLVVLCVYCCRTCTMWVLLYLYYVYAAVLVVLCVYCWCYLRCRTAG
jgi:hypothetical protein